MSNRAVKAWEIVFSITVLSQSEVTLSAYPLERKTTKPKRTTKTDKKKQGGIIRQQRTENRSKVINTKRGRKRDKWSKPKRTKTNSQDDRFKPKHINNHTKHKWSEYISKKADIVKLDFFPKRPNYMIPKKKNSLNIKIQ